MASLWDNIKNTVKKAGRDIDTTLIRPVSDTIKDPKGAMTGRLKQGITDPLKAAGKNVQNTVIDPIAQATGIKATPTPTDKQVKLDPGKAAAMSTYGSQVQGTANTFTPQNYGEGYYKPRTVNPQITQPTRSIPQVPTSAPVNTGTNILNQGNALPPNLRMMGSPMESVNTVPAPQVPQGTPRMSQAVGQPVQASPTPQQQPAQQMAGYNPNQFNALPQVSQVSAQGFQTPTAPAQGQVPNLALTQGQNNLNLGMQSPVNPNIGGSRAAVQNELSKATQPQDLQQGYGPDYVQTATDLATRRLDSQKQNAEIALRDLQGRSGNIGSSVANKNMMDLMAEYDARKADAADTANLRQQEAGREDRYRNIGVENQRIGNVQNLAGADYGMGMGEGSFDRQGIAADNSAIMAQKEFSRSGNQLDNATLMNMAQYGNELGQQKFINDRSVNAENFGRMMDVNSFNAGQNQQDFQNRTGLYNTDWQRAMAENQFNTGRKDTEFNQGMQTYNADIENSRYNDAIKNEAERYNINQKDTADVRNMGNYQNSLNNMANYAGNQIDPQSQLDYQRWLQEQQLKSGKATSFINLAGGMF